MESKLPQTKIEKLDKLAWVLDSSIRIPGTKKTIGLDGVIGLVPGIGDIASGLISSYILLQAMQMGASKSVIAKMTFNILLETTIGVIPLLGDIFDFIFKSNQRNVKLLQNHLESSNKHT